MSLRITPHPSHPTSTTNTTATRSQSTQQLDRGAPSAPGLHDTLRASFSSPSSTSGPQSTHPLETRLSAWTSTQEQLQHTLLRRQFGIAEPLRRGMELKMVRDADSFRPSVLGQPGRVHEEILTGRDSSISWEDVYAGQDGMKNMNGVGQEEMEGKLGIGKW